MQYNKCTTPIYNSWNATDSCSTVCRGEEHRWTATEEEIYEGRDILRNQRRTSGGELRRKRYIEKSAQNERRRATKEEIYSEIRKRYIQN
jgi:hypothetical protein